MDVRRSLWLNRLSLTALLAGGFSTLVALVLGVGSVAMLSQQHSVRVVDRLMQVDGRIGELGANSNDAMVRARRAEKDLLLSLSSVGMNESKARYLTVLRGHLAKIEESMAEIRALSDIPGLNEQTLAIDEAARQYGSEFEQVVTLYEHLGYADTGLEGKMRTTALEVEAILRAYKLDRLTVDLLTLRREEKNFIIRPLDKHVEVIKTIGARLKTGLAASGLDASLRRRLTNLADEYLALFDQYAETRALIETKSDEYLATARAIEPLLEKLDADASRDAIVTRDRVYVATQFTTATIVGVSLVATLLGLGIALYISRRIARPVNECLSFAQGVARGELTTRLKPKYEDEFAALANSLNSMTQSLQESHAALEQRAVQLAEANQGLQHEIGERKLTDQKLQQEVREHQLAAERAEYLSYYDGLTTLPNRSMFSKLLNQAISLARRDAKQLAVLFLDLDGFKNVNDTLGHGAGDLLLQEFGKRLQGCLRESDTVARLGGDEFVVLLPALRDTADAEMVAHKILAAASKSFVALGRESHVTASVGVSIYPKDGEDEQSLMKNADIAMYQAKENGKNNFQFYSMQINANSLERLALESSLRRALEHDEFQLHYQPKIDARSGGIGGTEALLRWQHPELGMVAPTKFLSIAEETGLIVSIGKWVLKTACMQNVAWQQRGLPHLNMAVNLSWRQFSDAGLVRDITAILAETGMSPNLLELEITESTLMHDVDKAIVTLKSFRDMGVRLAVDNFGTGYSSLSSLKQFPIDTIKIDGSFFRDLSNHSENRGIAEAIIAMGRTLSLTVVAEGVETQAQADFMRERACDEFQGFYFSEAVTAGKFEELLEAQTTMAAEVA
jgi:diguanylate cyclase (GGDEF)-like protein